MKPTEPTIKEIASTASGPRANTGSAKVPSRVPTAQEIMAIPAAVAGVYQLTDAEVKKTRSRLYALNKENAAGWKWRTIREYPYLLIWRIH